MSQARILRSQILKLGGWGEEGHTIVAWFLGRFIAWCDKRQGGNFPSRLSTHPSPSQIWKLMCLAPIFILRVGITRWASGFSPSTSRLLRKNMKHLPLGSHWYYCNTNDTSILSGVSDTMQDMINFEFKNGISPPLEPQGSIWPFNLESNDSYTKERGFEGFNTPSTSKNVRK